MTQTGRTHWCLTMLEKEFAACCKRHGLLDLSFWIPVYTTNIFFVEQA